MRTDRALFCQVNGRARRALHAALRDNTPPQNGSSTGLFPVRVGETLRLSRFGFTEDEP